MGLFSWLFVKRGVPDQPSLQTSVIAKTGPQTKARSVDFPSSANVKWRVGSFPTEVVGESNYQKKLSELCGAHTREGHDQEFVARIELELNNPYDTNAVVVKIRNSVVGYLPRAEAKRIGSQMKEEGITKASCRARVRGGWRTNQYDEGNFGVRLSIPQRGWIDFGTGRKPPSLPSGKTKKQTSASQRPEPSETGPLIEEWVAIIGAPKDGELAKELASKGARIMAGVGKSTTLLVVAQERPFTPGLVGSSQYRKAEQKIREGSGLRILAASETRNTAD